MGTALLYDGSFFSITRVSKAQLIHLALHMDRFCFLMAATLTIELHLPQVAMNSRMSKRIYVQERNARRGAAFLRKTRS